jgi:hypothetical protein
VSVYQGTFPYSEPIQEHDDGSNLHGTFPPTPAVSEGDPRSLKHHLDARKVLVQALPCSADIDVLLGELGPNLTLCYRANYESCGISPNTASSWQYLHSPDTHPVLLAKQMLKFALAIQYLHPSKPVLGLKENPQAVVKRLAESVIKTIATNDELLGSLEGLEVILLESLYHVNCGNIRRSWISMRRAVMVAELLGLHRPSHYRFKLIDAKSELDPEAIFVSVVWMERMVSVLLGLPSSVGRTTLIQLEAMKPVPGSGLPVQFAVLLGRILDRDQIQVPTDALKATREINKDILGVAALMPQAFWRPISFAGLDVNSLPGFRETRRALDHMCYYTLINQLHLPHMFCPDSVSQRQYSKMACVSASREILNREIALRSFSTVAASCRMGDFMALVAGMTLMLAHTVSHCDQSAENLLMHQRMGDRAIAEQALRCMKSMSELNEDVLAVRCGALLQDLLAVESDAAQGRRDESPHHTRIGQFVTGHGLVLKVPYVGDIRISGGRITRLSPSKAGHDGSQGDGVVLGGMGSISVDNSGRADPSNGGQSSAQQLSTTTAAGHQVPETQTLSYDANIGLQPLPDASASIDDWVFQGLDTAFFDALTRGNEPFTLDLGDGVTWS